MRGPTGGLQAAGAQPQPTDGCQHPAAPRRVSSDTFLRAASVAWAHLHPEERRTIRATCRNGRQLHERLTTELSIVLGRDPAQRARQRHQPTPSELRTSLGAMVRRGARLQALTVCFQDPDADGKQAQLLAVLEACSKCLLSRLELERDVPVSGATAEAVGACCPHLCTLHLTGVRCHLPPEGPCQEETVAEHHYGYSQLLTLCGPRLRELRLTGMGAEPWRALSYMALRRCTALTRLELQAPEWTSCGGGGEYGGPAAGTSVFSTVAQLTTLRSLRLKYESYPSSPETARPHATCVARLSALTALTHLQLEPSCAYEDHGDDWFAADQMGSSHDEIDGWCAVAEAHRTSLLSALRCMPQLESLESPTLWLRPSDLVPLTALTSLTLAGLLPPGAGHPSELARGDLGGLPPAAACLPPQLHTLDLRVGASPRALALLRPSAAFARLSVQCLRFGMSCIAAGGRLREEAVEAVGPALRLLLAYHDRTYRPGRYPFSSHNVFTMSACGQFSVDPREGSPNGHAEWIRQLQGLDGAFEWVALEGMDFTKSPADLSCLGQALCNLEELELHNCDFPISALPLLRCPMLRLTRLVLDLDGSDCEGMDSAALVPLLLLLCRPHGGAAPLRYLQCINCPVSLDAEECKRSLHEQLEVYFGVTGVDIDLGRRR